MSGVALATLITLALRTHAAAQATLCWTQGNRRRSWAGDHDSIPPGTQRLLATAVAE
ncbi:MAG: hypothetical protein J7454_00740 [Roseiflexus sp.]|nr:hypothetical protein [Roseiflexus sp.]MBO9364338.1 hypothetical protein [Roseiflexus sp.]